MCLSRRCSQRRTSKPLIRVVICRANDTGLCMCRKRCKHLNDQGISCKKDARGKIEYCITHGGGKRCQHLNDKGKSCKTSAAGKTQYCITHGGGKRCQQSTARASLARRVLRAKLSAASSMEEVIDVSAVTFTCWTRYVHSAVGECVACTCAQVVSRPFMQTSRGYGPGSRPRHCGGSWRTLRRSPID